WAALAERKARIQKENARRRQRGEPLEPVPLEGIGPEIVDSISRFFAAPGNRAVVEALIQAGVHWPQRATAADGSRAGDGKGPAGWAKGEDGGAQAPGSPARAGGEPGSTALAGRTFVITGTLPKLTREQAEDFVRRHGGK